nr:MAG TPA: hypothetical protein [Caudoviricetes sp.]
MLFKSSIRLPPGGLFYCRDPDGERCNGRMTTEKVTT